jgi:hypothetical protein
MNVKEMIGRLRDLDKIIVESPPSIYAEAADMLGEQQDRITALENKCALLAASWKKAEDELEKIRAALVKTSR